MARLKKFKFNSTDYLFPVEDVKVGTTSVVTDGVATIDLSGKADDNAVVKLTGNQTIAGTKTFSTSPVVPSKTSDATNTGTAIATEAQVYKKQDTLVSGTNIKTVNNTSLLGSGNVSVQETLVSGTNIKTINNTSLLGSGNIDIQSGGNYTAGEGIVIGTMHSDMQGPAPDGFHVPLSSEWVAVKGIRTALGGGSSDGTNFGIALKLPFAGRRNYSNADVLGQGSDGLYWSSSRNDTNSAYDLRFTSTSISPQFSYGRTYGLSVRCFNDSPVIPTSSWTKLYGTSIEVGGIFWSSTDGLISLSSDGTTWITIADKNLGATTVWNSGDTLSEANCGKYYQRGNNYGFPRTGTIANQSTTQVDASAYGPGNYYSSDTFIKYSGRWDSTDNGNLWGGVTQGTWVSDDGNTITNTGVLSVNGETGDVIVDTSEVSGVTTNQPSSPVAGSTYFDTTAGVLKVYNGTAWIEVGGGGIQNDTTGTTTQLQKIWVGSETEFGNLSSKNEYTEYHVY